MGRRHVKEFRPDEALSLISADREGKVLRCPSCGCEEEALNERRDYTRKPFTNLVSRSAVATSVVAAVAISRVDVD